MEFKDFEKTNLNCEKTTDFKTPPTGSRKMLTHN